MRLVIVLFSLVLFSCASQPDAQQIEQLGSLVTKLNSTPHTIEITTVYPQNTTASQQTINNIMIRTGNSANRINVSGDGHYLKISEEEITSSLPFFGEQRIGSGYSNDMGTIEIKDSKPKIEYALKDDFIQAKFIAEGKNNQSYNITLRVFSEKSVELIMNGSHKAFIRYTGYLDFD